jgi:SAM-dependent methyltransferase
MNYVWDERYSEPGKSFGEQPNDFLASQRPIILNAGKRALCLGEGEGRNALWLAQMGFDVTAVDLSAVGLRNAADRAAKLSLSLTTVQADLAVWQIEPDRWDLIVSIFCHLPSVTRGTLYRNVGSGLSTDGLFILEAYTPSQLARGTGGPSDPDFLANGAQLRTELPGIDFLEMREISRDVREGQRHTGMADVVQIVGRKHRLG